MKIVARTQNPLSSQDEFTQILSGEIGHPKSNQFNKMTDKLFILHKK